MHENEILVLIFATFVLAVGIFFPKSLRTLPYFPLLQASYFALWCAWLATNLEHVFNPALFNTLEHISYLTNSLLFFAWCILMWSRARVPVRD